MATIDERDKEVLSNLREARDKVVDLCIEHHEGYPRWISDISFAIGYFEGRLQVNTHA